MKKQYLFLLLLFLSFCRGLAHSDYFYNREYANVKVSILTGFHYEEINKIFILGQLAAKMSEELNYDKPIFLYFRHHYITEDKPEYFISYGRGKKDRQNIRKKEDWQEFNHLEEDAIVIHQEGSSFDITSTLKLMEYAIKNVSFIKKNQQLVVYEREMKYPATFRYRFYSIDQKFVQEQLSKVSGDLIAETLQNKIYRPCNFSEREFTTGCSYYWQENKYHIFWRSLEDYNQTTNKPVYQDTQLLTLDNIYILEEIENLDYVIFDTKNSFYYTDQHHQKEISQKHIIKNLEDYYRPFKVERIALDKISLSVTTQIWNTKDKIRTLIYLTEKDELIQDLDGLILNATE